MLIISYDIKDDKLRTAFSKMIQSNGGIRLQYSVYEVDHSQRFLDILKMEIETVFKKEFSADDSVMIFDVNKERTIKYGNAIHRDQGLLIF